jgi:hypothetical protein
MTGLPRYDLGLFEDLLCLDSGWFLSRIMSEPDTDPDQDPRPMAYFREMVLCADVIIRAERAGLLADHRYCHNHSCYLFFFKDCDTFEEYYESARTTRMRM